MSTYIDTSAFIALANADDPQHENAVRAWKTMLSGDEEVLTCSYVVCETVSLIHSRHGSSAVSRFVEDLMRPVQIEWVDEQLHRSALTSLMAAPGKSGPSLTDCAGFELIRRHRIEHVFAYDRHFSDQGFNLIGSP